MIRTFKFDVTRALAPQAGEQRLAFSERPEASSNSSGLPSLERPRAHSIGFEQDSVEAGKAPAGARAEALSLPKHLGQNSLAPMAARRNSMIEDLRTLSSTARHQAPSDKSGRPDTKRFQDVHRWTPYNREKARAFYLVPVLIDGKRG